MLIIIKNKVAAIRAKQQILKICCFGANEQACSIIETESKIKIIPNPSLKIKIPNKDKTIAEIPQILSIIIISKPKQYPQYNGIIIHK